MTENSCDDAGQTDDLLESSSSPVDKLYGDGAYDQRKVYETLKKRGIKAIIPPRPQREDSRHGNSRGRPLPRDAAIREIRRRGAGNG